jgi:integrase/recombinase XerD
VSFEQFCKERKYLSNVSPRTLEWYGQAWKAWKKYGPDAKQFVVNARSAGVSVPTINCYSRALNAYFKWADLGFKIPRLKEERKILPVFTTEQVGKLVAFRPRTFTRRRLYTLVLLLVDTGLRIGEALSLRRGETDYDNLLIKVKGKGGKQRLVPFSYTLRKTMWKYEEQITRGQLLFGTCEGHVLGRRDVLRDVKRLCRKQGFEPPERTLHAFRHTFAINYLRRGGSVFHLQKILGHSSLEMTRRYVELQTADLQAVHQKLSLLAS